MIPPEADAEFVAHMEVVLDTYEQPYEERYPVLNMDEQPIQLVQETRQPIPATKEHPRRVDYEYARAGTASIFLFCEPLAGWRQVSVRERRTKHDWAREVAALLQGRYAQAEKVILVCDNLNTHTIGAFYEAFDPATARAFTSSWPATSASREAVSSTKYLRSTFSPALVKMPSWSATARGNQPGQAL